MAESNIKSGNNAKGDGGAKVEGSHKDEQNTKTESKSVGTLRRFLSKREKHSGDSRPGWFVNFDKKRKKESEDERKVRICTKQKSKDG
jgi:hypothetical protein